MVPSAALNRRGSGGARGWRVRLTDYEFLTSPEARELIRYEQIVVIDYRAVQQAWCETSAPR